MHGRQFRRHHAWAVRHRSGFSWLGSLVLIGALAAAVEGGYYYFKLPLSQQVPANLTTYIVEPRPFRHTVTERGEIESSSNVEVRCEVQSRNTTGTAIIQIVPEGENVKEGDLLCRLDASAIKDEASQQQILCNTSEAAVIQARQYPEDRPDQ